MPCWKAGAFLGACFWFHNRDWATDMVWSQRPTSAGNGTLSTETIGKPYESEALRVFEDDWAILSIAK